MRRRDFITLLGGASAAWPLPTLAQQSPMPVVGFLYPGAPGPRAMAAFRKGLNEAGYVEGQNVTIEYRFAERQFDRLPELAADLVRRQVTVIAALGNIAVAFAAKAATTTIPIVFSTGVDPVQTGLVASLNRPGGNVTGVSSMSGELTGKRLGLLHELVPHAARFAALINPSNPRAAETYTQEVQAAASAIRRHIEIATASTNRDIDTAFASLAEKRADALLVTPDVLFFERRVQLVTLAAHHRVPAIYPNREFVDAGGLMSYGPDNTDRDRLAGLYTGRVLKGEEPARLPILRASKFEFVINLQTAKTLGLDVPATLSARADEVIE